MKHAVLGVVPRAQVVLGHDHLAGTGRGQPGRIIAASSRWGGGEAVAHAAVAGAVVCVVPGGDQAAEVGKVEKPLGGWR